MSTVILTLPDITDPLFVSLRREMSRSIVGRGKFVYDPTERGRSQAGYFDVPLAATTDQMFGTVTQEHGLAGSRVVVTFNRVRPSASGCDGAYSSVPERKLSEPRAPLTGERLTRANTYRTGLVAAGWIDQP